MKKSSTTTKPVQLIVSAFACLPDRGSEHGVAWNWVQTLTTVPGIHVTIITQARHQAAIESSGYSQREGCVEFIYISLLDNSKFPLGSFGHYIYYYLWQAKAAWRVFNSQLWKRCDVIHHLTYGGIRTGSFLWLFPKPFIFGPVGGGEDAPLRLVTPLGARAIALELIRKVSNIASIFDPVLAFMQLKATRVLVRTKETARLLKLSAPSKIRLVHEIGVQETMSTQQADKAKEFSILFAGRLIHWKGCDLLLDAIRLCEKEGVSLQCTIIGTGRRLPVLVDKAATLSRSKITFKGHVTQAELFHEYGKASVFVFPSLHDSGGTVVLEAMSNGLPVICLDLGGPPNFVGREGGIIVNALDVSYDQLCCRLAAAILDLYNNPDKCATLGQQAKERVRSFTWKRAVRDAYAGVLPGVETIS